MFKIPFLQNGSIKINCHTLVIRKRFFLTVCTVITEFQIDIVNVRICFGFCHGNKEHSVTRRGIVETVIRKKFTRKPINTVFFIILIRERTIHVNTRGRHPIRSIHDHAVCQQIKFTRAVADTSRHHRIRWIRIQHQRDAVHIQCDSKIIRFCRKRDPFSLIYTVDSPVIGIRISLIIFSAVICIIIFGIGIQNVCVKISCRLIDTVITVKHAVITVRSTVSRAQVKYRKLVGIKSLIHRPLRFGNGDKSHLV